MPHGDLIWADLSTFDLSKAEAFYARAFGWRFGGDAYRVAANASGEVAGLYTMPEKFVKIRMPSFWMSYIEVDSADRAAEIATQLGGKVEFGPVDEPGAGRIALIRDPLGAGFTVVEAPTFNGAWTGPGARAAHALIISNASAVISFYEALFGWKFSEHGDATWTIARAGTTIAELHEIPDPAIRGTEEFWGIAFATDASSVRAAGAEHLANLDLLAGPASLWRDDQGAAFFTLAGSYGQRQDAASKKIPFFAYAGLGLILLSLITGWTWIWAAFFVAWVITGVRDRATYLLETVRRDDHPALYWTLMAIYAALGVLALFGEV